MKMTTQIVFVLSLISLSSLQAKVWQATNSWSLEWEQKFSQWVQTTKVHTKMFTDSRSPYYGIKADCADASYAIRAIFSMENSLPFKVKNPSGSRSGYGTLNNDSSRFDYAGPANKRLVAMINYVGGAVGTEHLNYHDTLPVKIKSVVPGMLFTYKIKRRRNKFIRHAYNIKNVTPTGDFDVIYATQSTMKNGLPLRLRKTFAFSNAPQTVWGFKRFKWPALHGQSATSYPEEFGYSQEQFSMAKNLGARGFFRAVKKALKTASQTPEQLLRAKVNTLCTAAIARIDSVNEGLAQLRRSSRCMDYADYDAYSTPSRDKSLATDFENLFYEMAQLESEGTVGEVDYALWDILSDIRSARVASSSESAHLNLCSINYRQGVSIHLAELYRRMSNGLLSSHPNDGMAQRWGETSRRRTRCRVWY